MAFVAKFVFKDDIVREKIKIQHVSNEMSDTFDDMVVHKKF
jgi:hypothetical protein